LRHAVGALIALLVASAMLAMTSIPAAGSAAAGPVASPPVAARRVATHPAAVAPPDRSTLTGIASTYVGTAGFAGVPGVALPGPLGGRHTGAVVGSVTICAERCARLPIVDWCDCYWGTLDQRIADLSPAAWALLTDAPRTQGLLKVTLVRY